MMRYNTFVPAWTKQQFVEWANERYPGNNHDKMKKRQLIAIWRNT